jgi:NAD-dependent deacetylase
MIPEQLARYLEHALNRGKTVCFTGSGISAESGIPTFRGKGGLWERYDPGVYAYRQGLISLFRERPAELVNFVVDFYSLLFKARPNTAHLALGILEKENRLRAVITQNIDNLHQEAGNRNVVELHGNAFRIRCQGCLNTLSIEKDRLKEMVSLLKRGADSKTKILKVLSRYFSRCACGGRYRIDITLFGELLPEDALASAYKYLDEADTLLMVGTSLVVYPAAQLPLYAKKRGAKLIEINTEKSSLSEICDYSITGRASEVLPEILKLIGSFAK